MCGRKAHERGTMQEEKTEDTHTLRKRRMGRWQAEKLTGEAQARSAAREMRRERIETRALTSSRGSIAPCHPLDVDANES